MTRVIIFGASGMLGHKLYQICRGKFDLYATFRDPVTKYERLGLFETSHMIGGIATEHFESVDRVLETVDPGVVVNCIGVVKQDAAAADPITSISINALLPHQLAQLARAAGARFIHVSTDCVFSGRKGNYSERDFSDAEDLYGRTKYLGEVGTPGCLTLRTSMIGRELKGCHGLVEWFYSQRGRHVRGFKKAIFTGFTTEVLAQIIAEIIERYPTLEGVYHVAANPISKFDLLTLINEKARLHINIEPDETFVCDRSLDGSRFRAAMNFVPPSWSDMVTGLVNDSTPYDKIRRSLIAN